ncbi:MAG: hypothetical protein V1778_04680, partial [bacterium]
MPALRTEFSKFVIYDPDKSRSIVHCYASQPTPLEERAMGRLFLVVEIDTPDPQNPQLIEEIQRTVTASYYSSENFQIESAFERALQKTNEHLHGVIGEQLTSWLQGLNMVIAVLKDTTLHFTVIGRMHAFLIHRQRILDILEGPSGAPDEQPSPLKIFTNIISGQLNLGDSLLFCTTSILDHLSQEKLKRLIGEQSAAGSVRNLETLLSEAEGTASFGALIIQLTPIAEMTAAEESVAEREIPVIPQAPQTQDSMQRLIAREQATNTLLNHSLWLNMGRIAHSGVTRIRETLIGPGSSPRSVHQESPPESPSAAPSQLPMRKMTSMQKPSSAGEIGQSILRGIGLLVRSVFLAIIRALHKILSSVRKPSFRTPAQRFPQTTNRSISQGSRWFSSLTPQRRWIFLGAIVLILLFAQSVVSIGDRRETQQKLQGYQALLRTAEEKISAADAALLIKNESGARKLLTEAQQALKSIPNVKGSPQADITSTTKKIETRLESIRHIVAVSPELVADLAGLEVGFAASSLTVVDSTAFTFSTKSSSLYRIGIQEKKADVAVHSPSLDKALMKFVTGDSTSV